MKPTELEAGMRVVYESDGKTYTGQVHRKLMSSPWEVWVKFDPGQFPPGQTHHFDSDDPRHNHGLVDVVSLRKPEQEPTNATKKARRL